MAAALLALSDLINFQLARLKFDNITYKDELQLQRLLADLDVQQWQQHQQQQQQQQKHQLSQSQSQQWPQQPTQQSTKLSKRHSRVHKPSTQLLQKTPQQKQGYRLQASATELDANDFNTIMRNKSLSADATPAIDEPPEQRYFHPQTDRVYTHKGLSRRATTAGFDSTDDELLGPYTFEPTAGTAAASIASSVDSSVYDLQHGFKAHVLEWFQQLHQQTAGFKSDEESRLLREAGNDSYRKERHPLKACDIYTEAIFRAPAKDSIAAAMAHANRSTVLHDCGMYEQSYDDALCALDLGYPEEFIVLIKLRQAACALKMRNFVLCEEHLHELLHMELTELFQERTHEIWHECEVLKSQKFEMGIQTDVELPEQGKLYEVAWYDNSNIITTNKGSYLRATSEIAANTALLHDEAAVFVTSGQTRICDNCAITQFIPIPCLLCSNRHAVYCSRKCRIAHAPIHAIECFAHQIELFEEFGEEFTKPRLLQLAFRMLIIGLPQVVPHCRKKPTVSKMWSALNGVLTERTDIPYSAFLRLEYNSDADDLEGLVSYAIIAHILAIYLNECTDFFDMLESVMPASARLTSDEWELLSAALLLRHICQLRHKNLIHCPSFVLPVDPHVLSANEELSVWSSLEQVRVGQLHLIAGDVTNVAYAVFPNTLSLCKHSCTDTLYRTFSGRKLTAYATENLATGTNITNCFSNNNYRQSLYETRRTDLLAKSIDCKCEKCFRPYPDEDFHKFHRYRCDNPNCKQIFTPTQLKRTHNLRWWESEYYTCPENNGSELLVCSACEETQKLEWFWTYRAALDECDSMEERCKLYAAIDRADNQLVEMHECKVALARQLVERCLLMHRAGCSNPLDEWEFNKLGSIMRSALHIVAAQYRAFSIEYVRHMSYFWDVMALSNYKCSDKELMQMLHALDYIPDEYKVIFINYYEKFIAPKFADETYATASDTQV